MGDLPTPTPTPTPRLRIVVTSSPSTHAITGLEPSALRLPRVLAVRGVDLRPDDAAADADAGAGPRAVHVRGRRELRRQRVRAAGGRRRRRPPAHGAVRAPRARELRGRRRGLGYVCGVGAAAARAPGSFSLGEEYDDDDEDDDDDDDDDASSGESVVKELVISSLD